MENFVQTEPFTRGQDVFDFFLEEAPWRKVPVIMDRVEQIPCGIHVHRAVVAIGNAYQERFS